MDLLNPNTKNKLIIKTVTWQKDSHLLFDYQFTKNIVKDEFKISLEPSFVFFYRNNAKSEIVFLKQQKKVPRIVEGSQLLGCFEIIPSKDKKYKLSFHDACEFDITHNKYDRIMTQVSNNSGDDKQNEGIYFIVRSLKDNDQQPKGLLLKTGHRIKFGRVQFNVKIVKESDKDSECPNFFDYQQVLTVDENKVYDEEQVCKICLSNQQQPESGYFFCSPCDCYGSCATVHFQCLLQWCKTKVKKSKLTNSINQYNFDKFQCEICKKYFPRFIIKQNIKYDLLPIDKPEKPYLVLTSINNGTITEKGLIIIRYHECSLLKIGRNQTCDIRIVDISVSRQHATIQMKNDDFMLFDSKSKFGTIVGEPNFTMELEKIKRGIQVGRTVLTFQLLDKQFDKNKQK